jgi:MFS family permease
MVLLDISPLRESTTYRWLFGGLLTTHTGRQLTVVAVPFQVYKLTGSTLAVGLIGLAQLIPLLGMSLVGGALADAVDRKRLLVWSQLLLALMAGGLAANAFSAQPAVWPLYVLTGLSAAVSAVESPTRTAVLPAIVGRSLLPSALALGQLLGNVAKAVVPAAAGFLIATAGLGATYSLEAVLFIGGALLMWKIPPLKPEGGGTQFGLASIREGLSFLRKRRLLQATFVIDLNAMVFGVPKALFPAIATDLFGGDATTTGLLFAAPGIGALIAAITSGWLSSVRRQGLAVIVSVVVWGAAMASFGLTSSLTFALPVLAIAGAADVVSAVFRTTILQLAVPDELRGRLSSAHVAVVTGGPRLGDLEAGSVAALTSVRFSVISGGLACIAGALAIARFMPELARYRSSDSGTGGVGPSDESTAL